MKADILSLSGVPCRYQCWTGWPDHVTDDVRQHFVLTTLYLILLEPIMKSVLRDNEVTKYITAQKTSFVVLASGYMYSKYYVSFLLVQIVFVLAQLFLNCYKNVNN